MQTSTDTIPTASAAFEPHHVHHVLARWSSLAPYLLSTLRIVAAFLFIEHGTSKLFAFPVGMGPGGATAPVASLAGVAGLLELFGGLFLVTGLFTRPVAFIVAGEMAVAYFIAHAPHGFWPLINHGQPAILFCFIWLYLSSAGGGPWSVDSLRARRKG